MDKVKTWAPNVLKEVDAKVHKTRVIGASLVQFVIGISMIWVGGMVNDIYYQIF